MLFRSPAPVDLLVQFAILKTRAQSLGVEAVDRRGSTVNIKFHPGARLQPEKLMSLVASTKGAQFTPAGVLRLPLASETPSGILNFLTTSFAAMA